MNSGELLFNGNCVTCHFKTEDKSAPSIKKIQTIYKKAFPKKEEFIEYMSNWVSSPNKNSSMMLDDIDKYEIMPTLGFEKDYLQDIASYIYDTDFSKSNF
jgi:cytochrome c551/c552